METIWLGDQDPPLKKGKRPNETERASLNPDGLRRLTLSGLGLSLLIVLLSAWALMRTGETLLPLLLLLASLLVAGISLAIFRTGNQLAAAAAASLTKVHERSVKFRMTKIDLEEVDRIKTDFFNNVSHEFRTPITLTLGPIQGLLSGRYGTIDVPAQHQLKNMAAQQQRLLGLINQILEAAKLEAGLAELKTSKVPDFNAFIASRVEQFRTLSEQQGLELKTAFETKVASTEVYVDREKFDKILFNLLSNAHKFTKKGSIRIATTLKGRDVLIAVEDTGQGIRHDQLPHVFERFRQAEGSVSKDFAGTGLGLNLVREYSQLHGGDVTVASSYGQGTTFTIRLPTGKAHLSAAQIVSAQDEEVLPAQQTMAPASSGAEAASENAETLPSESNGPKVLYVDDNAELRKYVGRLLKDHYTVALAENGREGLETARAFQPALILSDVMMPEMDGTEFCRQVRQDPSLKSIPFVLLTARAELDQKLSGLEIGADDYLSKPFSEAELLARVKNLVALRENQTRLAHELQAARAIQQSLLPQALESSEARLDFLWHPCDQLSGDFCDLIDRGDWLYAYVADVTSHGTASAQVTYLLRSLFRGLLEMDSPTLDALIVEANRRYGTFGLSYDVALQMLRYQPKTGLFEYARGSAPSPLVVSASGESKSLVIRPGPNLSLPIEGQIQAEPAVLSTTLQPGDRVFLFTDGAYEISKDRQDFRLKDLHALIADLPTESWGSRLIEDLKTRANGRGFPDDITVIRLERFHSDQGKS